jgi:hypothetical protein
MDLEKEHEVCSHLEATAEMIGMELTPTLEGCEVLENILQGLSEFGDKGALNGAMFSSGVYLGKIIRQITSGSWEILINTNELSLNISGTLIFPHNAIKDFVLNPNENSLTFYASSIIAKNKP